VPPQISRPGGTLWSVPPQILVVASRPKSEEARSVVACITRIDRMASSSHIQNTQGLKGVTTGQHKGNFALQRLCNHGLVCRVLVNAVAMQIN